MTLTIAVGTVKLNTFVKEQQKIQKQHIQPPFALPSLHSRIIAGMGKWHINALLGNLKGRNHMRDKGINGRIILNWILEKSNMKMGTGLS
jgi:hypothetical protein